MVETVQNNNSATEPILASIPKSRYQQPQLPIGVMDEFTHQLIQIGDLYDAVNHTKTMTGALVLRRSINHPLIDAAMIRSKQKSVAELRADRRLRGRVKGLVGRVAKDEEHLYSYYRGDYPVINGDPNLYAVYKGTNRLLGYLANDLKDIQAESDYLNHLFARLGALREDDVAKFIKGPAFKTSSGLKTKEDLESLEPNLVFKPRDLKLGRALFTALPFGLLPVGVIAGSPELMFMGAYSMMFLPYWPSMMRAIGRRFDDSKFVSPIGEMYFANPNAVNAIDSLGRMDELLSLAAYADGLKVPVTLPEIIDAPSHSFEATDLKNPVMAKVNPDYVGNDADLTSARLTFLTGPNSGGKTSLSKTILQTQVLAQIGSAVVAASARLTPADGVHFHLPMGNTIQDPEGGFGTSMARTRDIVFGTTPKTISVYDELIGGATTQGEKMRHSGAILRGLSKVGGTTILATHDYEIAEAFEGEAKCQFWQVEFNGQKPTHRIIPGMSRESHSDLVMQRLGFTESDIERHLRKNGFI